MNTVLNINKALELARLLAPHLPEETDTDVLDFVGKIVSNIKGSETPEDFADAVMLLHDLSIDEIKDLDAFEAVELFIDGLANNQIISLVDFYKWLTT